MSQERQYEMKDSGVEWIGEVPGHWKVRPVKSYYTITTGFTPPSNNDSLYDENGEVWVTISDMNAPVISDSKQKINPEYAALHRRDMVPKGSLLYSFKLSVGSVAFAGTDLFTNEAIAAFHPSNDIDLNFLKYSSMLIIGNANVNIYGAKLMNQKLIYNAPIVFPSLSEQSAIASYLDEKCAAIDDIIAEAKGTIEEYKAWKASIIFEAVTKGLNPNAEMKDSDVEIIGQIPSTWSLIRQRFLCKTTTGDHDTQDANPDGEYPFYVRSPNVERSNTYTFEGEGILMAGDGVGAGKVFHYATGRFAIHQRVYCFYDFRNILPRFFFYFISNLFATEIDKGSAKSTVASVRLPMLKDFPICIPSVEEQSTIVAYLDDKCATIDSIIAEKEALIAELETYKKSLIFETVTGKRRVC